MLVEAFSASSQRWPLDSGKMRIVYMEGPYLGSTMNWRRAAQPEAFSQPLRLTGKPMVTRAYDGLLRLREATARCAQVGTDRVAERQRIGD